MINISGFGLVAQITASNTFPNGFTFTEFADDADPLDSPDLIAADTAMGLNGDMIIWSRPVGIEIAINCIPTTPGDVNMETLLAANRVGKNKRGARDLIGIVLQYPSSAVATLISGAIISGAIIPQVAAAGRIKTRQYRFRFENITRSGQ